jgi:hydroxymethylglutaryl-CoA reductase (NADPH)
MTPPLEPFKVAGNGLDEILFEARGRGQSTAVIVLTPIKYELEYSSLYHAAPQPQEH